MQEKNHDSGDFGSDSCKNNDDGSSQAAATRDLVLATSFRVQRRRKRMARCRRRPSIVFVTFGSSSSTSTTTTTSSLASPPSASTVAAMDRRKLRFLFEKELKNSDVSPLRRMVLPKKSTEAHLPVLDSKEGIIISMDDIDGLHVWSFKYRCNRPSAGFGPNRIAEWDFVNAHELQQGDSVAMYRNDQTRNFVIQAKKAGEGEDMHNDKSKHATGDIRIKLYPEVNDIIDYFDMIYPAMDDDEGMTFVYDTTSRYSPLDFLGGCMTNYTRIAPSESFMSVENFCSDYFA